MGGCSLVWAIVRRCGRLFAGVGGCSPVWAVVRRCGRLFAGAGGCSLMWAVVRRCGQLFADVGGCSPVWSYCVSSTRSILKLELSTSQFCGNHFITFQYDAPYSPYLCISLSFASILLASSNHTICSFPSLV